MSITNGREGTVGRVLCEGHLRLIEVLRVNVSQLRNLPLRSSTGPRPLALLVRLDAQDIYQSTSTANGPLCYIGDSFMHEVSTNFSQLHFVISEMGRIARVIGRVSVRKRDIVKHSGEERWYRLLPMARLNDISGQICLHLRHDPNSSSAFIKVVDYSGVSVTDTADLYLLVTLQDCRRTEMKKLKIGTNKESDEMLVMEVDPQASGEQRSHLRLSLWEDVPGGCNSLFHGQLRIPLEEVISSSNCDSVESKWYYLKPYLPMEEGEEAVDKADTSLLGELRLRLCYTADHVLPIDLYRSLQTNLINSLTSPFFCASPLGILEYLPSVELSSIARPLMKIFVQAEAFRPLLRVLCTQDINKCQDTHTLFRSQTLASKIIFEQMKFVGHQYLVMSLKPVIDMIYNERKCCEVDPSKLKSTDNLALNMLNLTVYGEVAFSRVVDSTHRCPSLLRETFAELRDVVSARFPAREDMQRLALGSFVIMRFFAAAIMNPKFFGLKREQPDATVSRTLVLVSKILQKLSNCVVSGHALSVKETWLAPVLQRFTDEGHRQAMLKFLDRISQTENEFSVGNESVSVLRDGYFIERRPREKRRILRNIINQKRRYVVLKEAEICWQKSKTDVEPKGRIPLQDVNHIEPVEDHKNVFRIVSPKCEIQLQAPNTNEMNEWIVQIQKQRKKQLMIALRTTEPSDPVDIDLERELEAIHITLYENADVLNRWKNALEGTGMDSPEDGPSLPKLLTEQLDESEDPEIARQQFNTTVQDVLHATLLIEQAHWDVVNMFMKQIRNGKGSRDLPIGDDNYLLLNSRFQKEIE